jgi:small subunit ribosomal protein S16
MEIWPRDLSRALPIRLEVCRPTISFFVQQTEEKRVAVRIRMKKMGRKHRPFFRICAIDSRNPRDGRVLEELGTYDPMVSEADARALLKPERINYWLGVGAQPSDKVRTLIKKYGAGGTHVEQQRTARERLAMPRVVPEAGAPVFVPPSESEAPPAAPESADNGVKSESPEQAASVSN